MNQEEYFLANQVDGVLNSEQTMRMLDLPEGDSTQVQSSVPDAATEPEPKAEVAKAEPEAEKPQVILAKDGVHTIPFEKLTEARESEQTWKSLAAKQARELEALKQPAALPVVPEAATSAVDFGDYSDEAIRAGVEKMVAAQAVAIEAKFEAKLAAVLEPIQRNKVEAEANEHFSTISKAHPDVESVVQSKQMNDWIEAQPSFSRPAIRAVIDGGTAPEVIELLTAFKSATGVLTAGDGKPDPATAAKAAIAKAQSAPPTSLSEIPAGSAAHHDQGEAVLEMSTAGLMSMFDGKSPDQIKTLLNRSI